MTQEIKAGTVVIGSGCAGLNAVDTLMQLGMDCLLVTEDMDAGTSRNTGSDKQTYYKLSLAGDEPDSVGELARSLAGGDMHGDIALAQAALSARCFLKLCALGVPFPTNAYGEYAGYQTDHDTRRRATSAGPLTSRMMTEALERSVRARGARILDRAIAVRIVTDKDGVAALDVWLREERRLLRIPCAHIILCTGGPAHVYADRVYPESQHGMSSLAFEAGAEGANLHCWQYGLASTGFRWNVSGSYQQALPRYVSVDADGTEREFLADALGEQEAIRMTFLKGYQWPFDPDRVQGSSRVDLLTQRETRLGRRVYLDYLRNPRGYDPDLLDPEARTYLQRCDALADLPIGRLRQMNEPAILLYRSHGIDLDREMLEIRVCAQHHNGGIAVDSHAQTCVPGLYAAGEAAGTFGRKRPGGSALNATQTGAVRAAEHIALHPRASAAVSPAAAPLSLPRGDAGEVQRLMTACAGIQPDPQAMRDLLGRGRRLLDAQSPACPEDADFTARLLLKDILVTQREVLSAMLYALETETPPPEGVLITRNGVARRVPARPVPDRELWFERVWKAYREERHLS